MKKVLFIDSVHPILEQRLVDLGYNCEHDYSSTKAQIQNKLNKYVGLVIRSRVPVDIEFLDAGTNLKFIARSGAGLENIDLIAAAERNIKVFNSPEGNMDAVGEHAIGMLLALFNQLKKGDQEVRNAVWDREGNRGLELKGKTVGIIGYGNMGSALAEKLTGFGCRVLAYDKYKTGFGNNTVEEVDLATLFAETQILSIHLPLLEETHHYVNQAFLQQFKHPIYLINTARGNNVCLADLVNAFKTNKVLGACLDVLEYETKAFDKIDAEKLPNDFKYLAQSDRVVLSPHVAGWSEESYVKLSSYLADKIEQEFWF